MASGQALWLFVRLGKWLASSVSACLTVVQSCLPFVETHSEIESESEAGEIGAKWTE